MKEQMYIRIKNIEIPIVLRSYKTAKHLKMYFKSNILYISKPKYVSVKKAMEFITENEAEIYKMYIKLNDNENSKVKYWNNGEIFSIKGENYTVISKGIDSNKINLCIDNDDKKFLISYPKNLSGDEKKYNIDKGVKKLLKYNTEIYLEKRVPYWSKRTNIPYKKFKVNDATSKFGSCLPTTKVMHFSSRLFMLPEDKIDAVIVHELCHIVHPNHSKDFYNLVRNFIPNYDEINKWLKQNSKIIMF